MRLHANSVPYYLASKKNQLIPGGNEQQARYCASTVSTKRQYRRSTGGVLAEYWCSIGAVLAPNTAMVLYLSMFLYIFVINIFVLKFFFHILFQIFFVQNFFFQGFYS